MTDTFTYFPLGFLKKQGKRLSPAAYGFLVLLCAAFFIPGIATIPATDRDESSFAQATKQMIETGNYIDIRLQDKPRYQKPIGIYWLQAASVKLFNPDHLNEIWAYRIPSVIGATLAVVMTAALGSLLFGPTAGFLAALMMVGCVMLNIEARLAKTDSMLLGCVMVAQYTLARAYTNKRASFKTIAIFWTALAAGILIKGPIILLVLASTLAGLSYAKRGIGWFNVLKPWFGIGYLVLLIAPWFVAILLQSHGDFATQSAGTDLLGKIWNGQSRGIMPPGMHLLMFPLAFFPFSLFALLAIPDTWRERKKSAVQFCLSWIVPTWIVFELALTKLPHYTMVTYPAIAILAAHALDKGLVALHEDEGRWVMMPAIVLWFMIGMGVALAALLLPFMLDHAWNIPQFAASLVAVIAFNASLLLIFRNKGNGIALLCATSLVFICVFFGSTLPSLSHLWESRAAADIAQKLKPCDELHLISTGYNEPSLIFLAGTNTKILNNAGPSAEAFKQDACSVALVDAAFDADFRNNFGMNEIQPAPMVKVEGFNLGSGKMTKLTLYSLPREQQ